MELRPLIACYSAESSAAIRRVLDARALELVARVAQAPVATADLDGETSAGLVTELVEMRVLKERDGWISLDTAVFLEEDLHCVYRFTCEFGEALAEQVIPAAEPLRAEPPEIRNFLVGIIAVGQSLHRVLKEEGLAQNWAEAGGCYPRSKVDFEQVCPAADRFGPDLQTKGVSRGDRFTAVLTGPEWQRGYLMRTAEISALERSGYIQHLNRFLTDAYGLLLSGQQEDPALLLAAEEVGLAVNGVPAPLFVTRQTVAIYRDLLEEVGRIAWGVYNGYQGAIHELLSATASGKQGVPDQSMSMHLWRYARRGIARAMYARGFFTDPVPQAGLITVFYENDNEYLREFLL